MFEINIKLWYNIKSNKKSNVEFMNNLKNNFGGIIVSVKTKKLLNRAVKWMGTAVYYFDKEGIYRRASSTKALMWGVKGLSKRAPGCVPLYEDWYDKGEMLVPNVEPYLLRNAISKLKEGDNLDKLVLYIEEVSKKRREIGQQLEEKRLQSLDNFITRIERPVFGRESENENDKTFDYIYVDACIAYDWNVDKKQYVKDNLKEIKKRVVNHLANHSSFKKFGVPVNFLRITEITLTKDCLLHFIFELKKI